MTGKLATAIAAIFCVALAEARNPSDADPSTGWTALVVALPVLAWAGACLTAAGARRGLRRVGPLRAHRRLQRGRWFITLSVLVVFGSATLAGDWLLRVKSWIPAQIPGLTWWLALLPCPVALLGAALALHQGERDLGGGERRFRAQIRDDARPFCLLLVPYLAFTLVFDLSYFAPSAREFIMSDPLASSLVPVVVLIPVVLLSPFLVRFLWPSQPLPLGPLRTRFDELAHRARLRVRDIRVWNTGGYEVINACIAGPFARLRYVFFTDGILRHLPSDELESVFAHELGHARHRHLLIFILVVLAFVLMFEWAGSFIVTDDHELIGFTVIAAWVYFRGGVGVLSRQLESQADLYSADLTGSTFDAARALERVAHLTGGMRTRKGWRHHPVPRRLEILWRASRDPAYRARFDRRTRRYVVGVVVVFLASLSAATGALYSETRRPGFEKALMTADLLLNDHLAAGGRPWCDTRRQTETLRRAEQLLLQAYDEARIARAPATTARALERLARTYERLEDSWNAAGARCLLVLRGPGGWRDAWR